MGLLLRALVLGILWAMVRPSVAHAGMGSFTLSDLARVQVQGISFFLAGFLFSSWLIQRLWNYLRSDFGFLPRLSYGKALGVVALWGLLFVLVMTMIAGARELMTPGAWIKEGRTYRLAEGPVSRPREDASEESRRKQKEGRTYRLAEEPVSRPGEDASEESRRKQLEALRAALWQYALAHHDCFPPDASVSEIPAEKWLLPDSSGMRYIYVPARTGVALVRPLAYEPEVYGPEHLVLLTNGEIRRMRSSELVQMLPREKP